MHRVFNDKPQLSKSFLVIDPAQVTDVFAVTQADDGTELTIRFTDRFILTVKLNYLSLLLLFLVLISVLLTMRARDLRVRANVSPRR